MGNSLEDNVLVYLRNPDFADPQWAPSFISGVIRHGLTSASTQGLTLEESGTSMVTYLYRAHQMANLYADQVPDGSDEHEMTAYAITELKRVRDEIDASIQKEHELLEKDFRKALDDDPKIDGLEAREIANHPDAQRARREVASHRIAMIGVEFEDQVFDLIFQDSVDRMDRTPPSRNTPPVLDQGQGAQLSDEQTDILPEHEDYVEVTSAQLSDEESDVLPEHEDYVEVTSAQLSDEPTDYVPEQRFHGDDPNPRGMWGQWDDR